jgi:hypothetical protein
VREVISTFLRTACHAAPVVQELENEETLVCPVRCRVCGAEAGAPGLEDVPEWGREALEFDLMCRQLADLAAEGGSRAGR